MSASDVTRYVVVMRNLMNPEDSEFLVNREGDYDTSPDECLLFLSEPDAQCELQKARRYDLPNVFLEVLPVTIHTGDQTNDRE